MSQSKSEKLLLSLKQLTDFIIKKHKNIIKSVWIITPDEILSNDDITLIFLIDDDKVHTPHIKELEADFYSKKNESREQAKVKIHADFYLLSEYFEKVMQGDLSIFREIGSSIPIYDPSSFFTPLKKLVQLGHIPGSSAALENLRKSVDFRLKQISTMKAKIVELLSDSVICSGQAALVAENNFLPIPRRVDEEMISAFAKDKKLPSFYAKLVEEVFEYQKSVEHGKVKNISGKDIDNLLKNANITYDRMEAFVSLVTNEEIRT